MRLVINMKVSSILPVVVSIILVSNSLGLQYYDNDPQALEAETELAVERQQRQNVLNFTDATNSTLPIPGDQCEPNVHFYRMNCYSYIECEKNGTWSNIKQCPPKYTVNVEDPHHPHPCSESLECHDDSTDRND